MGDVGESNPFAKRSLSFVPIPIDDQQGRSPMPMPELSWWERCKSWLRYHSVQLRWHVERSLARRFGRRWGG